MKKIYNATSKDKEELVDLDNKINAFDRSLFIKQNTFDINEMVLISKMDFKDYFFDNNRINTSWQLNGLFYNLKDNEIIIIEPYKYHIEETLNINPTNTSFKNSIALSNESKVLISLKFFYSLSKKQKEFILEENRTNHNIYFYKGDCTLALKMFLFDNNYIFIDIKGKNYDLNGKQELEKFIYLLVEKQKEINSNLSDGKDTINKRLFFEKKKDMQKNSIIKKLNISGFSKKSKNYKKISGLTKNIEGSIKLDDKTYASTGIGKQRKIQEDAVLLIKDRLLKEFKLIAVADGMGGHKDGEFVSNKVIEELKKWFENLSFKQRLCYYTSTKNLQKDLLNEITNNIQLKLRESSFRSGGSTLVCALVGKNDTLIVNIGDSRAYKVKKNKLIQVSREDLVIAKYLKKGLIPNKDTLRFHKDSNFISKCLGIEYEKKVKPYATVLNNKEYDMLLLFSDGVTDCLSEKDIAIVCKNTNKKYLAQKIVERAIENDSILKDEYCLNYQDLNTYIPGGKDNTTAAVIVNKRNNKEER